MKSFRLDLESIRELLDTWPVHVACFGITIGLIWLGWFDHVYRVLLILLGGLYVGYVLRGHLRRRLVRRFPKARHVVLLSSGMVIATAGLICRMLFPAVQASWLDIAWIAAAFACLLAFFVINRNDLDVRA